MRYLYDHVENNNSDARIKVENPSTDILLLALENDDRWPIMVVFVNLFKII